jgi:hypothetical protein
VYGGYRYLEVVGEGNQESNPGEMIRPFKLIKKIEIKD